MQKVIFKDLGLIPYREAWDYQKELLNEIIALKQHNRKLAEGDTPLPPKHYLLFCEHPPVYTLGKSGSMDHLLMKEDELEAGQIEFFKINRGGDITFHGPGQIVGYPIFDLDHFFNDVHKYVRYLEEAVIRTLAEYDLEGYRIKDFTGVWLPETAALPKRKICAIGVHLSRWVTMHGFAFNVNTALNYFQNIIPCGINDQDKTVTSLSRELGRDIEIEEVKTKLKRHFAQLFEFEFA
ncbi:MAG: lipoyl(octanoyl) transferase LipB [Bacteroidetes bacterium]|nr:MAG: lipoyl(octanoyl) transferase LipB [Bacteroidota bacterium]